MTTPLSSIIETTRRVDCEELSYTCKHIARWFSPETCPRRDGSIRIPAGQRLWAWDGSRKSKKSDLVDSILHGYPIPSCICNVVDKDSLRDYEVYDGRHRFETIHRFVKGEFTYKKKLYSELSPEDKEKFDNRRIPVTIVEGATVDQLAEIFLRLNSGAHLRDSDMFWAYRESPLVRLTRQVIYGNDRLSAALGSVALDQRADLANWVAYINGLGTQDYGQMTTSYVRVSDNNKNGLSKNLDERCIREGIDAVCMLYERANARYPTNSRVTRTFKKIGKVNAYFLAEWMNAVNKEAILEKWVPIVGDLRSEDDEIRLPMTRALQITGAQNLTKDKIDLVLKKLDRYLDGQGSDAEDAVDDEDED